jgi:hypothetical protein
MPDQATVDAEHGTVEVQTDGDNAATIAERAAAIVERIARSDDWRVEAGGADEACDGANEADGADGSD